MIREKILVGILAGAVLVVVVYLLVLGGNRRNESFSYEFGACSGKKSDSVELSQSDSSLTFTQILNTYCGSEDGITVSYKRSGKSIEIREVFDSDSVAKCICPQEIGGQIDNLKKGKYRIKFIFDNRYTGEVKTLAEEEFELR